MDWLTGLFQQQQQQQMEQDYVNQQLLMYGESTARTKKKDVLTYMQAMSCANEVEQVDEFETANARHICSGTKEIKVLPKNIAQIQTTEGMLPVEYFFCPMCRLLLVNKSCLQML